LHSDSTAWNQNKNQQSQKGNTMYGKVMTAVYVSPKSGEKIELLFSPPVDETKAAKQFVDWFNDNRVTQYLSVFYGLTEGYEADWIRKQNNEEDVLTWFVYVNDKLAGNVGLKPINFVNRHAEIGIVIGDKTLWGKGLASVMEATVLEYAFENVAAGGLNKVIARVISGNHASQKIQEKKIGFRTIGIMREEIWSNGSWHDVWIGEMLSSEWKKKKSDVVKNAGITELELYPGCEK